MIAFGSLFALLRGRRDVPEGGTALRYSGEVTSTLITLIGVSLVELVAVELLVPWPVARWILLALSIYALLWLLGYVATLIVRPHAIGPENLLLRNGFLVEQSFPLSAVRSVRAERCGNHEGFVAVNSGTLDIPSGNTTTVVVELDEPREVDLGKRGRHMVQRVRFHADDTRAAVRLLRAEIPV